MLARTSLMGKTKSLGTPFLSGWWERERWVFAMQMGKFPKPCEEGKEMCSLSINVSPLYSFNVTTHNPRSSGPGTQQGLVTTCSLSKKMGHSSPHEHLLAGWGCLLFTSENSLYGKAALCLCLGESVVILRQSSSSSCRNHFPRILISGTQKGNLEKGFVMRLLVTLLTHSWKLSGRKGPLCVGLWIMAIWAAITL